MSSITVGQREIENVNENETRMIPEPGFKSSRAKLTVSCDPKMMFQFTK